MTATGQSYPHKSCVHGECVNHDPDWEDIGEKKQEPDPELFGLKKTYWMTWCCGRPMSRCKTVQTVRCKRCGREKNAVRERDLALCLCCGRLISTFTVPDIM